MKTNFLLSNSIMKATAKYMGIFLMLLGTSIGKMYGAVIPSGYTEVSAISSLSTGDYVILWNSSTGKAITGWNADIDATASDTEGEWRQFRVTKGTDYIYLEDEAFGGFVGKDGTTSNKFQYLNSGTKLDISSGKLRLYAEISDKIYYLCNNSSYHRFYKSGSGSYYVVYKVNSPSSPDPEYAYGDDIEIDAGTYNGTPLSATTSSTYTIRYTYNSCGKTLYGYIDESDANLTLLEIRKANGSAYSGGYSFEPESCDAIDLSSSIKLKYTVSSAGAHEAILVITDYDEIYAYIPITITATAGCTENATVTAVTSSSIYQETATVSCASGISSLGSAGCSITSYGFVYSAKETNATPAIGGSGVTQQQVGTSYASTGTAFNRGLTGLTASTTYCVRAYATNGNGTAYSSVHEFTTVAVKTFGNYVQSCDDVHSVTYDENTTDDISGSLPTDDNEYAEGVTVYVSDGTISRTGYEFVGWNTDNEATVAITEFVMGAADVTLYAVWSPIDYTLTMATSVGGGSGTDVSDAAITSPRTGAGTVTKHIGDAVTVTAVAPAHHTFTGWTSSNGGSFANVSSASTTFTMPAGNTTVTACFTEDTKYTVTWSDNGEENEELVYAGETTSFPSLSSGCTLYPTVGWILDDGTFTSETLAKPAATIYAEATTTPAVTGNVSYKAVYRHKYYTSDDFEIGTTDGEAYYLYATYSDNNHYKTTRAYTGSTYGFSTTTSKGAAVPVYLIKTGDYYYMKDVNTDKYYYSTFSYNNYNIDEANTYENSDAYKWSFAASTCATSGLGDYNVTNKAHGENATLRLNSSGDNIKEFKQTDACPTSGYYNLNLEPAYYYKYSPTAACYDITVTTNAGGRGTLATLSAGKLVGNELRVTPLCGYAISSVSVTSGTATYTERVEGNTTIYVITPTSNCTFRVNFTTENDEYKHVISFVDGATSLGQTKTDAIYECSSYDLPNGYNTASGAGGACTDWTFDGWTATNYVYGQMAAPSSIQAAGSSQTASGNKTWYAVYHKTFAAGDYFNLKYGDRYIEDYGSSQFNTTTTASDALQFNTEDGYLYYIDKLSRTKKWVYFSGPSGTSVTISDNKPSSISYKTTFTLNSGTYEIKSNGKWLELNGSNKVVYFATTDAARRATRPNASSFTAYYPKTDCAIETIVLTFDAGAGNKFTTNSEQIYEIEVEGGSTITLPIASDLTFDEASWTFAGWSVSTISNIRSGAPTDLIDAGGEYTVTEAATLRAVYSQTPPNYTFDNTTGGIYLIWANVGGRNYYASNTFSANKLNVTETCSDAAFFEFVETETAGKYKIHIVGDSQYLKAEGCGENATDIYRRSASEAEIWTVTANGGGANGPWRVTPACGTSRGLICEASGSGRFGNYSTIAVRDMPTSYYDLYIGHCADYYTTNPNKELSATGDIKVTSTNGRMIMAKDPLVINASSLTANAPITITSNNSDVYFSENRNVNILKASKPTTSLTFNASASGTVTDKNIYVHYMPSVSTHGIENVLVTISSPDKSVEKTIKVRHLPATFAIASKIGGSWYALTGNMKGAANPKVLQVEVDESTWTAYAPDTCAYQLWPVKTTSGSGDRYQEYGERVRFSAVNNSAQRANAGLWANNSSYSNKIDNDAAITAVGSDPAEAYEWKITTAIAGSTWKYTLQTEQVNNTNNLNIHLNASDYVWGTYASAATNDIYLIPITEITPFEMEVVEWYPTKVLVYTTNSLSSPTVRVNSEVVAGASCTSKGGNLYEITNLPLATNPTKSLSILYAADEVTYACTKTIPVIISQSTQNVTADPFSTLTKEMYNYSNLVVRDGAKLTINGTNAENTFFDVTIYPTSKIIVPSEENLSVHSLTFFGGIDDIYDGSTYTEYKYGVPELSLKGALNKSVEVIDYMMRVDLDQMYRLAVPYDVSLGDIAYWDGSAIAIGTKLYVSAYDGAARAARSGNTWVWETDFETKFGEAKLKAGVGYTVSAEPQNVGDTYSIIRMPMTSNVSSGETEAAKTVAVTAHGAGTSVGDNHKGWNFVGNPYMVSVSGSTAGGAEDTKLVIGYLRETESGGYELVNDAQRYVTIPNSDGTGYDQQTWASTTLEPFKSFFVQVAETGNLSFALTSRADAPARNAQARDSEVEFEVILAGDSQKDHTGLLIADRYSPAYEINADLEKMENPLSVYTLTGGYKLAYNALSAENAKQPIPVGYIANTAGSFSFRLDENSNVSAVDHVWLTDYELDRVVDLLDAAYEFTTVKGRNETRFALSVELVSKTDVVTAIDNLPPDDSSGRPIKFIQNDKMYILNQGILYDATGKRVNRINK